MWIQRMRVNALDHYEKLDWLDFMAFIQNVRIGWKW